MHRIMRPPVRPSARATQRGAVAVLVAILLVALVGMVGLVLDAGHTYYSHSRLQIAADACALAGVRHLNGSLKGLNRAEAAGTDVAKRNLADFYGASAISNLTVTVKFNTTLLDAGFGFATASLRDAEYVRCEIANPQTWVSGLLAGFTSFRLAAKATAMMEKAAGVCAIPLAVCAREHQVTTAPSCTCQPNFNYNNGANFASCNSSTNACSGNCNKADSAGRTCTSSSGSSTPIVATKDDPRGPWGLYKGEWVQGPPNSSPGATQLGTGATGSFNWATLDGKGGANNLVEAFEGPGFCDINPQSVDVRIDTDIGNTGALNNLAKAWNKRLGIMPTPSDCSNAAKRKEVATTLGSEPDLTGWDFKPQPPASGDYSVTNVTDPVTGQTRNIYGVYDRTTNCPSGTVTGPSGAAEPKPCSYKAARDANWRNQNTSCSLTSGEHAEFGQTRRLVAVPVVKCSDWSGGGSQQAAVQGWLCGLIVREWQSGSPQPIEVIGKIDDPASPCSQAGAPSKNSIGGRVPTLVQ